MPSETLSLPPREFLSASVQPEPRSEETLPTTAPTTASEERGAEGLQPPELHQQPQKGEVAATKGRSNGPAKRWSYEEERRLQTLVDANRRCGWDVIARDLGSGRTATSVQQHYAIMAKRTQPPSAAPPLHCTPQAAASTTASTSPPAALAAAANGSHAADASPAAPQPAAPGGPLIPPAASQPAAAADTLSRDGRPAHPTAAADPAHAVAVAAAATSSGGPAAVAESNGPSAAVRGGAASSGRSGERWSSDEEARLRHLVATIVPRRWETIARELGSGRTPASVQQHWAKAMFSGGGGGDKSWYGVRGGPNPGVCSSWDAARKLSHGVSGARVKKFATEAEARAFARVLTPTQASEALLLAAAAAAHVSEGGLAGSEGALAGLQPNLASQAPATSSPAAAVAQEQQRQEQQQPQPPKPAWPAAYPVVVTKIASEAELAAAVSVAVAEPCNSGEALPPSRGGAGADSDGGRGRAKAPRWSADEEQKLAQLLAAKEATGQTWGAIARELGTNRTTTSVQQHWAIMNARKQKEATAPAAPAAPGDTVAHAAPDLASSSTEPNTLASAAVVGRPSALPDGAGATASPGDDAVATTPAAAGLAADPAAATAAAATAAAAAAAAVAVATAAAAAGAGASGAAGGSSGGEAGSTMAASSGGVADAQRQRSGSARWSGQEEARLQELVERQEGGSSNWQAIAADLGGRTATGAQQHYAAMAKRAGGVSSPVESMAMDDRPCEKDALCTRGYRHLGRGGPCSRKPRLKRARDEAPDPGDAGEAGAGLLSLDLGSLDPLPEPIDSPPFSPSPVGSPREASVSAAGASWEGRDLAAAKADAAAPAEEPAASFAAAAKPAAEKAEAATAPSLGPQSVEVG